MKPRSYPTFLLLYLTSYMGLVCFAAFLPAYLDSIGFSQSLIGILLAVSPLVSIVAQPIWGNTADRARSKNRVLLMLFIVSGALSLLFFVSTRFVWILLILTVFAFFRNSVIPLGDTITLEYAERAKWNFGPVRAAGTIGYAVMALITGYVVKDNLRLIFILLFGVSLASAGCTAFLPQIRGHRRSNEHSTQLADHKPENRRRFRVLFRHRRLMLFMGFNFFVCISIFYNYAFFPVYYRDMGAGTLLLGLSIFIATLPEIPLLFFVDRIYRRTGPAPLLLFAGVGSGVRWLLYFFIDDPVLLLPVQLIHGITFILILFSMARYVNETVAKELKASGQTLNSLVINGLAMVTGTLAGGFVSEAVGIRRTYLYVSLLLFGVSAIFAVFVVRIKAAERPGKSLKTMDR